MLMEDRIKAYEKFIAKAAQHPNDKLLHYHREMLANFQHERVIHLMVTLFFVALALVGVGLSFVATVFLPPALSTGAEAPALVLGSVRLEYGVLACLAPLYLMTLILVVMSVFYVKHYYFLENHIQALYDYSAKLALKD